MTEAADFKCPRCTSRYRLVRVRADREFPSRLIHCRVCKEPFAPTDGEYVLKYFLVDKAKKRNGIDLRMNHPPERRASKLRLAPSSLAGRLIAQECPCRDEGGGEIARFFASSQSERLRLQH